MSSNGKLSTHYLLAMEPALYEAFRNYAETEEERPMATILRREIRRLIEGASQKRSKNAPRIKTGGRR